MRRFVRIYVEKLLHDRRERLKFSSIVLLFAFILIIVIWRLMAIGVVL